MSSTLVWRPSEEAYRLTGPVDGPRLVGCAGAFDSHSISLLISFDQSFAITSTVSPRYPRDRLGHPPRYPHQTKPEELDAQSDSNSTTS